MKTPPLPRDLERYADQARPPRETPGHAPVIGRRHGRIDGPAQVTGAAIYADDLCLPRMLHGKILRSPHAHARIVSIDVEAALALPGVEAVITGQDLMTPYGIIPWTEDEHVMAVERALFVGDAVAAVAALDEATAEAACGLIEVEWEVLPHVLDPEEALREGAPVLHPHPKRKGNLTKEIELSFGDPGAGDEAATVVEGDYFFHGTTHAAIEPHCAIGEVGADGLLTVHSATQVPHYLHRALARVLELPPNRIRVVQPAVGGGFGGKSEPFDLEFCVALLSLRTGRPVKILYTREEVFLAHRGRHPTAVHAKLAVDDEGRLQGYEADLLLDGGAYASFGLITTYYSGQLTALPYRLPAYRYRSRRAYTNKPACGPKRGHGAVQPRFALEVSLDKAAHALGIDPIELRRRNFIGENTRTVNELRVGSLGLLTCLDEVERRSEWKARRGRLPFGHGLGVACSAYISGTNYPVYPNEMPLSAVQVAADRSGRVRIFSGASEIGQGSDTMLAAVCAQELGVELTDVRVVSADTDLTPVDLGAYSSRITLMAGHAALHGTRQLAAKVRQAVAEAWEIEKKNVALAGRLALDITDPSRSLPIAEAFALAEARFGTLGATGYYHTPKDVHGDYRGGAIGATPAFSATAHVVEVIVDPETGVIGVEKVWCAHDCGRALNPLLVEGQIEGSCYMGLGEALMEHHEVGPGGRLLAPDLLDYRIPTSVDTPPIEAIVVEAPDAHGPYGAKEAGEGPLHSVIPALANAVFDAIGVRIDTLPLTPEKVLAALDARLEATTDEGGAA
ncbi:MAG: xanthine dehydrogenase family protein molybdopterin-binding subunit [Deltaproteobacteria bacterium]|nr:xanthine dehydrogenase family protein molybdopterin-binding subunit [Deltaproteobacteria bacterium]